MTRRRVVGTLTRLCVAGIMIGILFMIQPFTFALFQPGFLILLAATIGFTIVSHIPETPSAVANLEVTEDLPVRLTQPENS